MKVIIGNYRNNWISPYHILERIFFWTDWSKYCRKTRNIDDWRELDSDEYVDYPQWVENLTTKLNPFCEALYKFLNIVYPRIEYVKIDKFDTWNMDHTLALIVIPMLKQLRDDRMSSCEVFESDLPDELKSAEITDQWNYILNEMLYAFETHIDESIFDHSTREEILAINTRIQRGFTLFGKYYTHLWD